MQSFLKEAVLIAVYAITGVDIFGEPLFRVGMRR